ELVEDGVTGRLLTVEDRPIERQAEALRTLLDRWRMTPEATTTMAQAGQARVRDEFSLTGNVDRLERLFNEAVA
ncbi:MAG: hypothetical protein AAF561_12735, partial [Planctomycetota bacterium]